MKRANRPLLAVFVLQACLFSIQAQTLLPSQWESFINSSNNILIQDTFRTQSFEKELSDNWKYVTSGNTAIVTSTAAGFGKDDKQKILKLSLDSKLSLEHFSLEKYTSARIQLNAGGKQLMKNENLNVRIYYGTDFADKQIMKATDDYFGKDMTIINIKESTGVDIWVSSSAHNTRNGYYGLDSIYAIGDIPLYSLFKGTGEWNDTTRWSHLPAARNRNALINGTVTIQGASSCNQTAVSNGKIRILPGSSLQLNHLALHGNNVSLISEGDLAIRERVHYAHTFQEKGAWYFISFPFDIYRDGIDPAFSLKDATFDKEGNVFYVQEYNGSKRSDLQNTGGSWETLPESAGQDGQPIFRKNKGYLIALDEGAESKTLTFSSKQKDIPDTFGKTGAIQIDIPLSAEGKGKHDGWYLCGNPLLSPLPVSQLKNNYLDGYIYIYDGDDYRAVSLRADYVLPPFSAFFVKAHQSVNLLVEATPSPAGMKLLSIQSPLRSKTSEPAVNIMGDKTDLSQFFRMGENHFYVENAPEKGWVEIVDIAGRMISRRPFSQGESYEIMLPSSTGFYILVLKTLNYRTEYKLIR